jgi:hypothetical protein
MLLLKGAIGLVERLIVGLWRKTMSRLAPLALITMIGFCAISSVFAQSEEEVHARIEQVHGDANGFFELFSLLQDAMMFGDPVTFAAHAAYPLTVNANGEVYDVLAEQDLLDNFDTLVAPDTQAAISNQDVDELIVTSEGIGIGNGALWVSNICVDERCASSYWAITAVNN